MLKFIIVITFASILLLTGCAWVKSTPEGEKVRLLEPHEVTSCKEIATTTVSLMDKVAGINRNPQKVAKELQTLARNSAAKLGGDTVVPLTEVNAGEQRFTIYRCVGVSR